MVDRERPYFDLELSPGRSLDRRQFTLMIAGVALLFLLMALRLLFLGAWPVVPFMVADILLLIWAMRASYHSARQSEHLRLDAGGMELVHISAAGRARRTHIEAARARVKLEPLRPRGNRLWIDSNGHRTEIGHFLSSSERAEIAPVIERGLGSWRRDRQRQ